MPKGTTSTIFSSANASSYLWGQQGGNFGRFPVSLFTTGNAAGNTTITNPAFLDLTDVDPTSYANEAGKFVAVNANATGLTFSNATLDRVANCFGVGNATPANTGAGITFPATAAGSTDVNTLDDYEEGTWTPVLNINGATTGITYSSQYGAYTKIGNTVFITLRILLTSKGSSVGSTVTITGLPFTSSSSYTHSFALSRHNNFTYTGVILCYLSTNTTTISVQGVNNGTVAALADTNLNNNTDIIVSGSYFI